jgi:DNA-binding MarR family transcriptional regulator
LADRSIVERATTLLPWTRQMTDQPTPLPSPDRLDARELRAWKGLLEAHATLARALDAELQAGHGLTLSQYEVLMVVADAPGEAMRMADIADRVLLSRSGLTRLVDRLAGATLIERRACPSDARGALAHLTPAGRERLDAARRTHLHGVRRMFLSQLDPEEQNRLGDLWERVMGRTAAA